MSNRNKLNVRYYKAAQAAPVYMDVPVYMRTRQPVWVMPMLCVVACACAFIIVYAVLTVIH